MKLSNIRDFKTIILHGILAMGMEALSGCASNLSRENIFANTETAYGLTIAQNAQTQIPEIKLGYARHELFYVPSSKTVMYRESQRNLGGELPAGQQGQNFGDPSRTPQVLADIAIGSSGGTDGASFRVRQRLAVGSAAVSAPAAQVLMASGSPDAAALLRGVSASSFEHQRDLKKAILTYYIPDGKNVHAEKQAELQKTINKIAEDQKIIAPEDLTSFVHDDGYSQLRELVSKQLQLEPK